MADYLVETDPIEQRIELYSGGAFVLPAGVVSIVDMGPFLQLQKWSAMRQLWLPARAASHGNFAPLLSTGANYRIVNSMNCAQGARVTNGGSGYSKVDPPTVGSTATLLQGTEHPEFRVHVGGGVHVAGTGGLYKYPPILIWDYSGQVAPFRPIQIAAQLDNTGAVVAWHHDGNSQAGALGSTGATAYSGAGINLATLPAPTILRHPNDDLTSDVSITVTEQGADQVTAIDLVEHGCPVGNDSYEGRATVLDHKGGSGLQWSIQGNNYVIGVNIVDGGSYTDNLGSPVTSTGAEDFCAVVGYYEGDDEISRGSWQAGLAVLTAGVITNVAMYGFGPFIQGRVRFAVVPGAGILAVESATLTPNYGPGGDYFTYQLIN